MTTPVSAAPDCDADGQPNAVDLDDDNDLLSDALEVSLKTDTCNPDTDGDGMTDGWEYQSAIDLNNAGCNTPAYPTPCDPGHAVPVEGAVPEPARRHRRQHGLRRRLDPGLQEHAAWAQHAGHDLSVAGMWYSDGLKSSQDPVADGCVGMPIPAPRAPFTTAYADLLDRQRQRLPERRRARRGRRPALQQRRAHGQAVERQLVGRELRHRAALRDRRLVRHDWLDGDTDGDGIYDGIDDQDHDDYWNVEEQIRGSQEWDKNQAATNVHTGLWVHPFNPCLPNPDSRTCPDFVPAGTSWAPFPKSDGTFTYPRWPLAGSGAPTHPIAIPQ